MFSKATTLSLKRSFNWFAKGSFALVCNTTLFLGVQAFGVEGTLLTIASLPAAASLCLLGGSLLFAGLGVGSATYDTYRAAKYILRA